MQKIFKDKNEFVESYRHMFKAEVGKDFDACTDKERFDILVKLIAVNARDIAAANEPVNAANNKKKVYYFSLEFLIGRLLDNYLLDFGVRDIVADGLKDMGVSLEDLCNQEHDAGLGNGGLGRLAACFLDSMAHEGIEGYGNGMRYRYGLFKQSIKDG
ncbi:MAG: glycogen/starch/alpha-glucan phosphorylase, partial [Atopobiaceae bacterium]|nr:glycogen/starch/alpha-glucan phosphorylase [Atopobiaceae bacterium]